MARKADEVVGPVKGEFVASPAVRSFITPAQVQLAGLSQIIDDGLEKYGLLTDGARLYFSEFSHGRMLLSTMPVEGGPIQPIQTSIADVRPTDLSPDKKACWSSTSPGRIRNARARRLHPCAADEQSAGNLCPELSGKVSGQVSVWTTLASSKLNQMFTRADILLWVCNAAGTISILCLAWKP